MADRLRGRIQMGELAAGTWLRETRLAQEHGVGRTIVRQALRILADDGLVRIEANRGACVAEASAQEMFDLYELRAALSGAVARFACFRASDAKVSEIAARIEALVAAAEAGATADALARQGGEIFRLLAVHASPDARDMLGQVNRKTHWRYAVAGLQGRDPGAGPIAEWRALAHALTGRDPDAAAEAGRRIVHWMQDAVSRAMLARGPAATT